MQPVPWQVTRKRKIAADLKAQPRDTEFTIHLIFNCAMSYRLASSSPGKYAGRDNGWVLSLIYPALIDFDKSIIKEQCPGNDHKNRVGGRPAALHWRRDTVSRHAVRGSKRGTRPFSCTA